MSGKTFLSTAWTANKQTPSWSVPENLASRNLAYSNARITMALYLIAPEQNFPWSAFLFKERLMSVHMQGVIYAAKSLLASKLSVDFTENAAVQC